MASSQTDPDQIDRLSDLPDALLISIFSLLPTRIAACTSVLSRRFRDLWKTSPSLELSTKCLPLFKVLSHETVINICVGMANSALLSRTSSHPLLYLEFGYPFSPCDLNPSFISSLLVHAHTLGLRHLTIGGGCYSELVLRSVFSISSLEYLSIRIRPAANLPSEIAFTRLRSLSINFLRKNSTQVQWLLSELCCLEDLQLIVSAGFVCLSSRTIKKLELLIGNLKKPDYLGLSMPSLEFLCLKNLSMFENLPCIHGHTPILRKAVVTLDCLRQNHNTAVAHFLNCISHVEELSLDLEEHLLSDYPFSVLMEPGKRVPTFPNMKHLDVSACLHEYNFEVVVTMIHHSTELESLKLHHKRNLFRVKSGKRKAWKSRLPCNSDGNNLYACFNNLHLGENRNEFKKLLNKNCGQQV